MLSKEADILLKDSVDGTLLKTETAGGRHRHGGRSQKCANCGKLGHMRRDCFYDGRGAVSRRPRWWRGNWSKPEPLPSLSSPGTENAVCQENTLGEIDYRDAMSEMESRLACFSTDRVRSGIHGTLIQVALQLRVTIFHTSSTIGNIADTYL